MKQLCQPKMDIFVFKRIEGKPFVGVIKKNDYYTATGVGDSGQNPKKGVLVKSNSHDKKFCVTAEYLTILSPAASKELIASRVPPR